VLQTLCHSERSEESLFPFMELNRREILRFAQNDKVNYSFRSLLGKPVNKGQYTGDALQRLVGPSDCSPHVSDGATVISQPFFRLLEVPSNDIDEWLDRNDSVWIEGI